MRDFSERMEIGKTLAQDKRNRGYATGKSAKGWDNTRKRELAPWEQAIETARLRFALALDEAKELHYRAAFPQRYKAEDEIPF